ncbi:MAG TPA: F0F1 ATP synthase subunit delta [Methanothrix sp.]|nr:F0F1 ATP synthase subunit delta [Methanothrix sp.]
MQIDYFTTLAQMANFLILVLLLRHFLYAPVLKLMDERERVISSRFEEVEEKKREAEEERETYLKKKQEISAEHEEMLIRAKEDAKSFRAELEKKAEAEVERSKAEWYGAVESEKKAFLDDLKERTGSQVYAISRRVLQDLADEVLERQMTRTFIERLEEMEESEKEAFKEFYKYPEQLIVVRSAFEIPADVQLKIKEVLREQTGTEARVRFEIDEDLISGIEISARNAEISWSIAGYLDSLEAEFSRVLEQRAPKEKRAR